MPSSLVAFPGHNEDLPANTNFTIAVTQQGMDLGFFTNAKLTYYSAPTFLNGDGLIIGHTHVTVQDLGGSFNPTAPADPTIFAFFLGINTPLNQDSQVFAAVPGGLPAGFYRVCTMVANANHSPVQMPVAQRGAQDDCKYFSVGQTNNPVAIPDFGNVTPAAAPAPAPAPAAPAPAATTSAAAGGKKGGKNGGGKNRGGKLRRAQI
jgi:transcription initiation factor TFIID subunit 15